MDEKRDKAEEQEARETPRLRRGVCFYCESKIEPNYKDIDNLARFVTDRGKIVARMRSGVCAKHQRRLAKSVKRARHLALLPLLGA